MRKTCIYIPSRFLSLVTAMNTGSVVDETWIDVNQAVDDLTYICEGATFIPADGIWYGGTPYQRFDEPITIGVWIYNRLTPAARLTAITAAIDRIVGAMHAAGETSVLVESSDVEADFR